MVCTTDIAGHSRLYKTIHLTDQASCLVSACNMAEIMSRLAPDTALFLMACFWRITIGNNCPTSIVTHCSIIVNEEPISSSIISTTAGNYSVTASCRCYLGSPTWRFIKLSSNSSTYSEIPTNKYCMKNNMQYECDGGIQLNQYASDHRAYSNITDYVVEESTILFCGDSFGNNAKPLVIMISDDDASYEVNPISLYVSPSIVMSLSIKPSLPTTSSYMKSEIAESNSSCILVTASSSFSRGPGITSSSTPILEAPQLGNHTQHTSTDSVSQPIISSTINNLETTNRGLKQQDTVITVSLSVVIGALVIAVFTLIVILVLVVIKGRRNNSGSNENCCIENSNASVHS